MKPYIKNRMWIILVAVLLIFVYKISFFSLASKLFTVLSPVITAFLFAWLLIPIKVRLECKIKNKFASSLSAFAVYITFIGMIAFFIIYLIPILKDGIVNVFNIIAKYYSIAEKYMDKENISALINPNIYLKGAKGTMAAVYNLGMSFVVLIYVLLEHRHLKKFFANLSSVILGNDRAERLLYYLSKTNTIFTGYLYSRLVSSLILGILVTIGFIIMDMKYPLFFGITVAISNLIPIFGAFISGIPIALTALTEYGFAKALASILIIVVGQQIENNILTPKIVGNSIGLSSFWILFSVIAGGGFFGFWGLLICIPSAAALKMLYEDFTKNH